MTVWHDTDGSFEHYTLLDRRLVEQGPVSLLAAELLEELRAGRDEETPDLRDALLALRERMGPEEMLDEYNRLMELYDEALDDYEEMLQRHNRVVDHINELRREEKRFGHLMPHQRRRLEEFEEALPEARENLQEASEELDRRINAAMEMGRRLRERVIAVNAELSSPDLRAPEDPRRTTARVQQLETLPVEPNQGESQ